MAVDNSNPVGEEVVDARHALARAAYNVDGDHRRGWGPWETLIYDDPERTGCLALADRQLAALAEGGYRVVKVDEDTKTRVVRAGYEWLVNNTSHTVPDSDREAWAAGVLRAALAVLEGDEHE